MHEQPSVDPDERLIRLDVHAALTVRLALTIAALLTVTLAVGLAALISASPAILQELWSPGVILVWLIVLVLLGVLVGFTRRIWRHLVKLREFRAALAHLPIGEGVVTSINRYKTLTVGVRLTSGQTAILKRFSTANAPDLGQRIAIVESASGLVEGAWSGPRNPTRPSRPSDQP